MKTSSLLKSAVFGVAIGTVGILAVQTQANAAGIPTADYMNYMQQVLGYVRQAQDYYKQLQTQFKQMDLMAMLSGAEIDAQNNAAANIIVRTGRAMQEIQQIEIARKEIPALNACKDRNVSQAMERAECQAEDEVAKQNTTFASIHAKVPESPAEFRELVDKAATSIMEECTELVEYVNDEPVSMCTRADLLMSGGPGGVIVGEEEAKATEMLIQIISGALPDMKTSPNMGDTARANASRINDLRRQALRQMVHHSLAEIRAARLVMNNHAPPMQLMLEMAESRWGTKEGAEAGLIRDNAHMKRDSSINHSATEAQVIRDMASMQAFQTYYSVLQFQQQLRMEALQAAMLSLEIEPLKEPAL